MVHKGPFMEFLRGRVSHSGGTNVESARIAVPSSKTEELACLIHQIEIKMDEPTYVLAAHEWIKAGISKQDYDGDANMPNYENTDMIWIVENTATEGIVVGPFGRNEQNTYIKYFDPPLLYAKADIWLLHELDAGQPAAKIAQTIIGYTLEKVSREAFIEALID